MVALAFCYDDLNPNRTSSNPVNWILSIKSTLIEARQAQIALPNGNRRNCLCNPMGPNFGDKAN